MYGNGVNNDAWYEPPEPTGMTDVELKNEVREALMDDMVVIDAITEVLLTDRALVKLFRHDERQCFHELLLKRVVNYVTDDIVEQDTGVGK